MLLSPARPLLLGGLGRAVSLVDPPRRGVVDIYPFTDLVLAAYDKWHENELERWLSDHDVPYSAPSDRKDLEKLVRENWQAKVVSPYQEWDPSQLQRYLGEKGQQVDKERQEDQSWLVENVKKAWYETESAAADSYSSVRSWIFDRWVFPLT